MSWYRRVLCGWLVLLATSLHAQEGTTTTRIIDTGGTVVEVEEPPDEEGMPEKPDVLVGMDAYNEVLRNGEYLVGPGDRFVVYVSSASSPLEVRVLAEGGLFIPRIGRVPVGGRRLREVRAAIDSAFHANVVVGEVAVELSELRQFPITVSGMVHEPGVTVANGAQRVSEVIHAVRGLTSTGSRRNIRLIRTGALTTDRRAELQARARVGDLSILNEISSRRVDLDMFEFSGLSEYNPFVEDGDIIAVPALQQMVRTMEAWVRPRILEFVQGDRIDDLITLSWGPARHIDPDRVLLFRFYDDGSRQQARRIDLEAVLAGDPQANLELQPGDWLVARSRPGYHQSATAQVVGEVLRPGPYIVDVEGTPLTAVIGMAGGFTEEASLPKARVVRQLQGEDRRDPEFDRIVAIPPAAWDKEEKRYFNMRSREQRGQMVVNFVALFEESDVSQDILVRPGDVVNVPASQRTVVVTGQAASPGAVPYDGSYDAWDYIERAGGFGWRASKDVEVIKARTGERMDVDDVERIEPGDRIWIKEEPARDYWLAFTQAMQVTSQVATVALLFVTILR